MFRASQSLLHLAPRPSFVTTASQQLSRSQPTALKLGPVAKALRFSTIHDHPPPPKDPVDREHEKKVAKQTLRSDPTKVSAESSVRHLEFSPTGVSPDAGGQEKISTGVKHDLDIIKDTFRLSDVPRESRILGLAGTLPYLGTSLSTTYLAWDLAEKWPTGNAFYDAIYIDHETAKQLLSVVEPLQLGYGAVIISFLGAIHWGLEYAEKQPHPERTRFRYGTGLAASIIAWPTLLMPVEYALTTQFMAFIALYFADSRAATRGWAPYWYGTYRFLLTAIVGTAIFISLVGRTKIGKSKALSEDSVTKAGIADRNTNWAKLEEKEKERVRKGKKEAERKAKAKENKEKQEEMVNEKGGQGINKTGKDGDKEGGAEGGTEANTQANQEESQGDGNEGEQEQKQEQKS